jgi:hypothetical protein
VGRTPALCVCAPLQGTIPSSWFTMWPYLVSLEMSSNLLSGTLPAVLPRGPVPLFGFASFEVQRNNFSGAVRLNDVSGCSRCCGSPAGLPRPWRRLLPGGCRGTCGGKPTRLPSSLTPWTGTRP